LAPNRLGRLQREVLSSFFRRERRFFLTGGAALAGFHLGHRETNDLDLFVCEDLLEEGTRALADTARELSASVEAIRTAPDFRRYLLRRGPESVIVDLVREYVFQMVPEKPLMGGIRVDPPIEILANKLCALLSRAELRDLVDVHALEEAGFRVEEALAGAAQKNGGLTAAQLAWVLSQIRVGDEVPLPGGGPPSELKAYLTDLIARVSRLAFPGE